MIYRYSLAYSTVYRQPRLCQSQPSLTKGARSPGVRVPGSQILASLRQSLLAFVRQPCATQNEMYRPESFMDHRIFRTQPYTHLPQKLLNCQMHEALGIVLCIHREIGAKLSRGRGDPRRANREKLERENARRASLSLARGLHTRKRPTSLPPRQRRCRSLCLCLSVSLSLRLSPPPLSVLQAGGMR